MTTSNANCGQKKAGELNFIPPHIFPVFDHHKEALERSKYPFLIRRERVQESIEKCRAQGEAIWCADIFKDNK